MKIAWLEHLVSEGHISKEAQAAIYADCETLVKEAMPSLETATNLSEKERAVLGKIIDYASMAAVPAVLYAGSKIYGKYQKNVNIGKYKKDIDATRQAIKNDPDFAAHQEKAQARLEDLVVLAPSLLSNPALVKKIIKDKVHSGFTPQDVQNLTLIQTVQSSSPAHKNLSALAGPVIKKASLEAAGETLATISALYKEAGIKPDTLRRSAENMLLMSAIPVLGGLGVGAVKHIASINDKKNLKKKLDESFNKAMDMSGADHILSANPDHARQAFQTLAHFSPHVALEPTAAKSFMTKLVEWAKQGPQIDDIKQLSEIQRNYSSGTKGSPFFEGLGAGSKALGLDSALKASTKGMSEALEKEVREMALHDIG